MAYKNAHREVDEVREESATDLEEKEPNEEKAHKICKPLQALTLA